MIALAVLALFAPQSPVAPVKPPTGPVTVPRFVLHSVVSDPGFESAALAPWKTGGKVTYYDKSPDGSGAKLVGQSIEGYVVKGGHSGTHCFRMNAEFPAYVLPGAGNSAATYVQQDLPTPVLGSAIRYASVWAKGDDALGLTVEIEYTAGPLTSGNRKLKPGEWQRWDFRSVVDPKRTVKRVRFTASGVASMAAPGGVPTFIDDVGLSVLHSV